jgi:hypothetical protein
MTAKSRRRGDTQYHIMPILYWQAVDIHSALSLLHNLVGLTSFDRGEQPKLGREGSQDRM